MRNKPTEAEIAAATAAIRPLDILRASPSTMARAALNAAYAASRLPRLAEVETLPDGRVSIDLTQPDGAVLRMIITGEDPGEHVAVWHGCNGRYEQRLPDGRAVMIAETVEP